MSEPVVRLVCIGGGIAGPIAAIAIRQRFPGATALHLTVVEGRPLAELESEIGSYFTLSPNAIAVLEELNIADVLDECESVFTSANALTNEKLELLVRIPLGNALPSGRHAATLKRWALAKALRDRAERDFGVTFVYGKRFRDVSTRADGQRVATFEDGTELPFEGLIGCDGIRSRVRGCIEKAMNVAVTLPHDTHLLNFGGFAPYPAGAGPTSAPWSDLAGSAEWKLIFGSQGFLGAVHCPRRGGVVWFVNLAEDDLSSEHKAVLLSSDGTQSLQDPARQDDRKRVLKEIFDKDFDGKASLLIHDSVIELDNAKTMDIPSASVWVGPQMVVVGDAAHAPSPSSGQGAGMAIEDGLVLAMALEHAGLGKALTAGLSSSEAAAGAPKKTTVTIIDEAFATFERSRRERCEAIVAHGARGGKMKKQGSLGKFFRDWFMRNALKNMVTPEKLAWMYEYRGRIVTEEEHAQSKKSSGCCCS